VKRAIGFGISSALVFAASVAAQERAPVVINEGQRTYRIAVQRFADDPAKPDARVAEDFRAKVLRALEFSGVFTKIEDGAFLGPVTTPAGREDAQLECPNWSQIGADGLVEGEFTRKADGVGISFRVWDPTQCKRLMRRRYQQTGVNLDATARRLADDIVEAFVGTRGVSGTEIAYVSDRGRGGAKEIYVMNADGSDARAATANRSINNFPAWSPDGDAIVYTSYRYLRRPFLFLSSRGSGQAGPAARAARRRASAVPRRIRARPRAPRARDERRRSEQDLHGGSRRPESAQAHQRSRDRSVADVLARWQAHRVRLRQHGRAADLRDGRRWRQLAETHLRRLVQYEPDLVARRAVDRLRDAREWPVRHLADRSRGRHQRPGSDAPAQRRGAELGAQLAHARVQLDAPRARRPVRSGSRWIESAAHHGRGR
jgi:hypothetical protein